MISVNCDLKKKATYNMVNNYLHHVLLFQFLWEYMYCLREMYFRKWKRQKTEMARQIKKQGGNIFFTCIAPYKTFV